MSKLKTKDEISSHKEQSISNFSAFLDDLITSDDPNNAKRADLISYWLKDFQLYLSQEKAFDAAKIKSYKRGDVIKVNLGFNVGSEQGGLRYAIVLDKDNKHNSKTITVVPLTSQKEEKKVYERDVLLGRELYTRLKAKYDSLSEDLAKQIKECQTNIEQSRQVYEFISIAFADATKFDPEKTAKMKSDLEDSLARQAERLTQLQEDTKALGKINVELHRMKDGSIAKIEQVTTISKQRIFDPRKSADALSGIRFSDAAMDKINENLKELYIF